MVKNHFNDGKAWVVAVDMGYGHQRTAFPLRQLAPCEQIINANSYQGISDGERKIWQKAKAGYEFISAFTRVPILGKFVFSIFDRIQEILTFYPKRDLSRPSFQLKQTLFPIKKGWGRHLIKTLSKEPRPLIGTFFTVVFMAEYFNYPGDIYCVVCDTDISRTWAPLSPRQSKIKYFAPTQRVVERLKLYGVKPENIFFTGYPLPMENIGGADMKIIKKDLKHRLLNLDPQEVYCKNYKDLIAKKLGKMPKKSNHPLTLMFAVGGAGAQKEIGVKVAQVFAKKLKKGEMKLILVAGIRSKVRDYFSANTKGLPVEILFAEDMPSYFKKFNEALRQTDILWTKPSELSFYAGLGIPIIIAPPIGSQEQFNQRWLLNSGYGFLQQNPNYVQEWLSDWLKGGFLAEAAMEGFVEVEKLGVLNIKKVCFG